MAKKLRRFPNYFHFTKGRKKEQKKMHTICLFRNCQSRLAKDAKLDWMVFLSWIFFLSPLHNRIPLSITCTLYIKIGYIVSKQGRIASNSNNKRKKEQDDARRRRIIMVSWTSSYPSESHKSGANWITLTGCRLPFSGNTTEITHPQFN